MHHLTSNSAANPNFVLPIVEQIGVNDSMIVVSQAPKVQDDRALLGNYLYNQMLVYHSWRRDSLEGKAHRSLDSTQDDRRFKPIYDAFMARNADTLNNESDYIIEVSIADSVLHFDPRYKKMLSEKRVLWVIIKATDSLFEPFTESEIHVVLNQNKIELMPGGDFE